MLTELWQRHLGTYIDLLWGSVFLWRTLALLLLSAIVGSIAFRNKIVKFFSRENILEHDKNIFTKADALFPERNWIYFYECLLSDHSYRMDDMRPLDEIVYFYCEKQNQYIDKKLNLAVNDFVNAFNRLRDFMSVRFFVFPEKQLGDNLRMCMQPEFNIDRAGVPDEAKMKQYDKWTNELENIVNEARSKYDAYRLLVKKKLLV